MVAPVKVFELRTSGGEWGAYPRVCTLWEEGLDCDTGVEVKVFANVGVLALFSGCMCVAVWGRGEVRIIHYVRVNMESVMNRRSQ